MKRRTNRYKLEQRNVGLAPLQRIHHCFDQDLRTLRRIVPMNSAIDKCEATSVRSKRPQISDVEGKPFLLKTTDHNGLKLTLAVQRHDVRTQNLRVRSDYH